MRVFSRSYTLLCAAFTVAGLLFTAAPAKANVISIAVTNGSFESVAVAGTSNQLGYHTSNSSTLQQVTGWTNANAGSGNPGYNFVFTGSSTTNSSGQYGSAYGDSGSLGLWGGNGITTSPDGGNFLAMDGAYEQSAVSQVLTGLTVGMDTKVYFYYAGAQQYNFTGPTTEAFNVSLTDNTTATPSVQTVKTNVLSDTNHGFTGWYYTYVDFVPTSTTETLSFLAVGTPAGEPPFSLLDGISVVQVTPEPSTLALLGTGVLGIGGMLRRRRASKR